MDIGLKIEKSRLVYGATPGSRKVAGRTGAAGSRL